MEHPLIDLLAQAAEAAASGNQDAPAHLDLNIASYNPLTFQVNVKLRDATLAWGTAISGDPVEAMVNALDIALRGEEARKKESQAVHHEKKELASNYEEVVKMEYGDQIATTKVELVPYKGWVVVVFPKPGQNLSELLPRVELRDLPHPGQATPAGRKTELKPTHAATYTAAPEGGRASLTKDKLEAEYKGIFGKGPDRNIKKLDLAKLLDNLENEYKAAGLVDPRPSVPEEDEEDLL